MINPTNTGTNSLCNHIKARIIMAIVGTELKKFNMGIIILYTNFEMLDSIPIKIAKNRHIKKPHRLLNMDEVIIFIKLGLLTISIKLLIVLLIVGNIT